MIVLHVNEERHDRKILFGFEHFDFLPSWSPPRIRGGRGFLGELLLDAVHEVQFPVAVVLDWLYHFRKLLVPPGVRLSVLEASAFLVATGLIHLPVDVRNEFL